MKVIKPVSNEDDSSKVRIFLGGSIEMGKAEMWQDKVAEYLNDMDVIFFNPRRDDWDSSWEQSIDNPQFKEQVLWELRHIKKSDVVLLYFQPETQSPITLLELGVCAGLGLETLVCCPDGFWRKGNVDIVCEEFELNSNSNFNSMLEDLKSIIQIQMSLKK